VANAIIVFARQVKHIHIENIIHIVFEVGDKSMWNSTKLSGVCFPMMWN